MVVRYTPTLNESRNDTGRTAFCGPTVMSAITGYPIAHVEAEIHAYRERTMGASGATRLNPDLAIGAMVTGTYHHEVAGALEPFGYEMIPSASFADLEKKDRPTVWSWMQRPRNAWVHHLLAIHTGRVDHWILIRGVMICDTYTGGAWTFAATGPHKSRKIIDVHIVRKSLGV